MVDYSSRLLVPLSKTLINLYSKSGSIISDGYNRIVIGKRGPYVELQDDQLYWSQIYVPYYQFWRIDNPTSYYIEYRTISDNIKIYFQQRIVDYADYKIGLYYISPFDLYISSGNCIISSKDEYETQESY